MVCLLWIIGSCCFQFWQGHVHSLASVFILLFAGVTACVSTNYGNHFIYNFKNRPFVVVEVSVLCDCLLKNYSNEDLALESTALEISPYLAYRLVVMSSCHSVWPLGLNLTNQRMTFS